MEMDLPLGSMDPDLGVSERGLSEIGGSGNGVDLQPGSFLSVPKID